MHTSREDGSQKKQTLLQISQWKTAGNHREMRFKIETGIRLLDN